jgi:hypothetical protein
MALLPVFEPCRFKVNAVVFEVVPPLTAPRLRIAVELAALFANVCPELPAVELNGSITMGELIVSVTFEPVNVLSIWIAPPLLSRMDPLLNV